MKQEYVYINRPNHNLELYKEKYKVRDGEEYILHHFLKQNDWILGLNIDAKFVMELFDEAKAEWKILMVRKAQLLIS